MWNRPQAQLTILTQGRSADQKSLTYGNDIVIPNDGLLVASASFFAPFNTSEKANAALDILVDEKPIASNSSLNLGMPNAVVGPYTLTVNASGIQFLTKGTHRIEVKGTTQ